MNNSAGYGRYWSPAFDNMEAFVFLIDKNFRVAAVNKSFLDFTGEKSEAFIGKKCHEVIHDTTKPFDNCPHKNMLKTGRHEQSEFFEPRIKRWLSVSATPIFDDKGALSGSIHIAEDITSRKHAEESLQKQREEQQSILDAVPASIFYKDMENRFVRVNKTFSDIMGRPKKAFEGLSLFDMYPREQAELFWNDDKEVMASGKPKASIIEPMDTPKGLAWVRTDKIPYRDASGNIIGVIGFAIDITDLKIAQDALAESTRYLDKIINSIADPVFAKDKKHRWVLLNDAFCRFFGKSREELLGKSDYAFFPKAEADVFWEKDEEVLTSGKENVNQESFTDANKNVHTIVTKKALYRTEHGESLIVGTIRDITEQLTAAAAIRESEEKYRSIYQFSADAIMTLDPDNGFRSGNPATIYLYGCKDEADFTKHTPASLSPEFQPDGVPSTVKAKAMMDMALDKGSNYFEWVHIRTDGSEFYATVLLTRINIGGKDLLLATVRDITAQKKLEVELNRRIESLEKFQKITVDRELRMKELKARVAQLEEKLKGI